MKSMLSCPQINIIDFPSIPTINPLNVIREPFDLTGHEFKQSVLTFISEYRNLKPFQFHLSPSDFRQYEFARFHGLVKPDCPSFMDVVYYDRLGQRFYYKDSDSKVLVNLYRLGGVSVYEIPSLGYYGYSFPYWKSIVSTQWNPNQLKTKGLYVSIDGLMTVDPTNANVFWFYHFQYCELMSILRNDIELNAPTPSEIFFRHMSPCNKIHSECWIDFSQIQ